MRSLWIVVTQTRHSAPPWDRSGLDCLNCQAPIDGIRRTLEPSTGCSGADAFRQRDKVAAPLAEGTRTPLASGAFALSGGERQDSSKGTRRTPLRCGDDR